MHLSPPKTSFRLANRIKTTISASFLLTTILCVGLAFYCYGQVRGFYADAQPLDAVVTNLMYPSETSVFGPTGYRFDVTLKTPLNGKQTFPMTGLYRVDAKAAGSPIQVLYNPHTGTVAMRSPWNYVGGWVPLVVAISLLAITSLLITKFRFWTCSTRLVTGFTALCCAVLLAVLAAESRAEPADRSN